MAVRGPFFAQIGYAEENGPSKICEELVSEILIDGGRITAAVMKRIS